MESVNKKFVALRLYDGFTATAEFKCINTIKTKNPESLAVSTIDDNDYVFLNKNKEVYAVYINYNKDSITSNGFILVYFDTDTLEEIGYSKFIHNY